MSSPPPTAATTTAAAGIFSNPPPQPPNQTLLHPTTAPPFPPPPPQRHQTLHPTSKQSPILHPFAVHRPFGYNIHGQNLHHFIRPSSAQFQQTLVDHRPTGGGLVVPNSVTAKPAVAADGNGFKDTRDKSGDDTSVTIRDRKVQVSEDASVYALCRSWLKNGVTENHQPQYSDCMKSLPKPLPASMVEVREEVDKEEEEPLMSKDVEHLSAKELLQQHIERAKRVRARLRKQRLQRIERYKSRLALLLPPVAEQQKNDSAAGN